MGKRQSPTQRFLRWAVYRPRHYWAGLLVPLGLLGAGYWFPMDEHHVRYAALALQLIGFVLLLWGVVSALDEFGQVTLRSTLWNWALAWWRERPFFVRHQTITGSMVVTDGDDIFSARGTLGPAPNWTLEQRVQRLEENYRSLHGEVGKIEHDMRSRIDILRDQLRGEASVLRKEATDLANRLKAKFVDGIGTDLLGVWYFVLGSILGSIPQEISLWLD